MAHFEMPLDIPDVRILTTEISREGDFVITVASTVEGTTCHKCGRRIDKSYGHDRWITLRHLPILGRKTFIRICPKRYQCSYCDGQPVTTQQAAWYNRRSPHTKAYETHVLLNLVNSTVTDVSRREALGYEAVMGIIDRHVATGVDWDGFEQIEVLGIDEIALKKGHKDFVTLVTSRSKESGIRLLAVLKDRRKATVKAFFSSIPRRLQKTIGSVCSDLYDGFVQAAKEVFGNRVKVVADRFHVAKLYRKGLESLRKKEMRRLNKTLSAEAYRELKGVMWILRKDSKRLTPEEQAKLNRLFGYSPALGAAYVLSTVLTRIFDENLSVLQAKEKLGAWKAIVEESSIDCFDKFLVTLEARMEEIANYFSERHSSGFVEGLNNKIKVLKRRCYGIFNIDHLFQRIRIDLEGHALFA